MPYTLDFSVLLGKSRAGLTDLRAQLVDSQGAAVGSPFTTGFSEPGGSGNYLWHCEDIPSGHRGGVRFYSAAQANVELALAAINPEEGELIGLNTVHLADGSIKDSTFALPDQHTGPATGPVGWLRQLWQRFFDRVVRNGPAGTLRVYDSAGNLVTTQTYTSQRGVDDIGPAV